MRQHPTEAPAGTNAPAGPQAPAELRISAAAEPGRLGRPVPFGVAVLTVLALVAGGIVLLDRVASHRLAGRERAAGPGVDQATRLVAATMPPDKAFEPELAAYVSDIGSRIALVWLPAGASVSCDVTAEPALAAERHRIAVASTVYATSMSRREQTGRYEQLFLTAVAIARPGADQVLDELTKAIPGCDDNPLGALRQVELGALPNVDGVVFRGVYDNATGADPAVSCAVVRRDTVILRSCGLAGPAGRADELAVSGLAVLQPRLEQARHDPNLPAPTALVQTPTWAHAPTITVPKNTELPVCPALTSDDVATASGQPVRSFDHASCRWRLEAGSVGLLRGDFGSFAPQTRTVLRGNSARFGEHTEGECTYQVAVNRTTALQITVTLDLPKPRPCPVARQLLGVAVDRLPPA